MGQNVTVVAKPSSNPEVLRFEINRSLTGMGHERYTSLDDVIRDRPVDRLARGLLEHGGVDAVHVNSSMITVTLAGGSTGEGLGEVVARMFRFYDDAPTADAPTAEVDAPAAEDPAPAPDAAAEDASTESPTEPAAVDAEAPTEAAADESGGDADA